MKAMLIALWAKLKFKDKTIILLLIVLAIMWIYFTKIKAGGPPEIQVVYETDTLTVKTVVTDTVLRWRDKYIYRWKEARPETIYWAEPMEIPVSEKIIAVDYEPKKLSFISEVEDTVEEGMGVKEFRKYRYKVRDEFGLRPKVEGWFVKTRYRWYKRFGIGIDYPLLMEEESGINMKKLTDINWWDLYAIGELQYHRYKFYALASKNNVKVGSTVYLWR